MTAAPSDPAQELLFNLMGLVTEQLDAFEVGCSPNTRQRKGLRQMLRLLDEHLPPRQTAPLWSRLAALD